MHVDELLYRKRDPEQVLQLFASPPEQLVHVGSQFWQTGDEGSGYVLELQVKTQVLVLA